MRLKALIATRARYTATCAVAAIVTTLMFAFKRGQDTNWDQLNYHLSIPFLILHGTFWDSIAPSGIQSYFNPLIFIPQYIAISALPPLAAVATIDVAQAMAFVVAATICLRIAGPEADKQGYDSAFLGFVLCLASPMALSEAGTTIVDLILAVPVLLAYLLLLTRDDEAAPRHASVAAGLLLGLATGLKITNAVFAIGAPAFFLTGPSNARRRMAGAMQLMLGTIAGFACIAGWWHLEVWRRFHNPTFPYFNNIFHSPDFPPVAMRDNSFVTHSPWALLTYPWHWLVGGSTTPVRLSPASETDPKDARFAYALVGAVAVAVLALVRRQRRFAPLSRPETGLLLACAIDFPVWLYIFGIHRYMVPLEILCGTVVLVLACWLATGPWRARLLLMLVVLDLARVHVGSWQRLPWQDRWRAIAAEPLALPGRPLIFLTSKSTAFLALSLPPQALYVDLTCGEIDLCGPETTLTRQLWADLHAVPPFTLYAEIPEGTPPRIVGLTAYGLRLGEQCQRIAVVARVFLICDVQRTP
jgi:Glycosyltransferase family 87